LLKQFEAHRNEIRHVASDHGAIMDQCLGSQRGDDGGKHPWISMKWRDHPALWLFFGALQRPRRKHAIRFDCADCVPQRQTEPVRFDLEHIALLRLETFGER
jgi:hypothetical protein